MSDTLLFATSTELVRVPSDAVVYVTADGNYSSLTMADGAVYVLTMQLGQVERYMASTAATVASAFIRIGKSLIINRRYITFVNVGRQRLVLSDCRTFRHEVTASREALRALKELIEKENSANEENRP